LCFSRQTPRQKENDRLRADRRDAWTQGRRQEAEKEILLADEEEEERLAEPSGGTADHQVTPLPPLPPFDSWSLTSFEEDAEERTTTVTLKE